MDKPFGIKIIEDTSVLILSNVNLVIVIFVHLRYDTNPYVR